MTDHLTEAQQSLDEIRSSWSYAVRNLMQHVADPGEVVDWATLLQRVPPGIARRLEAVARVMDDDAFALAEELFAAARRDEGLWAKEDAA